MNRASSTYFDEVNKRSQFITQICCDFKKLEKACLNYDPNFKKKGK